MQTLTLLHKLFSKALPCIHTIRLNCLFSLCHTAASHHRLFLTGLARSHQSKAKTRSNIEKVNRLLGNQHLQSERRAFYQYMASRLISPSMRPWIHVDWCCINSTTNLYVLRASVSARGRSIVIYEACYPKKKENNHPTHKAFLKQLKAILPEGVKPIMVTDAGFRAPWFEAVLALGWDFVGRVRHKNLVSMDEGETWRLSGDYYQEATGKANCLGRGWLTKKGKTAVKIVLYKGERKNRHKLTKKKKKVSADGNSKRQSKAAKEPWFLVSSLAKSEEKPLEIVKIYRQRMRIEENFRDTKSHYYGLGLSSSLTRSPERMSILLLIGAIATFAAWLSGLITMHKGFASDFQSHSAKFKGVLSVVYLGREAIKRRCPLSKSDFKLGMDLLTELVTNTQLEQLT